MASEYDIQREKARNEAIEWQLNAHEDISLGELWEMQQHFIALGEEFGLTEEFHENGII